MNPLHLSAATVSPLSYLAQSTWVTGTCHSTVAAAQTPESGRVDND
jgi:hypothetical protein